MGCSNSKETAAAQTAESDTNSDISARAAASVKVKFIEFTFTVSNKFWEKLFNIEKFENVSQKLARLAAGSGQGDVYIPDTDGTPYKVSAEKVVGSTDGFSDIYRIILTHPNKTEQKYFVKVLSMDKDARKEGAASGVHERELKFYRDILPAINNLIKEKNLHNDIQIPVPKLFYGKAGSSAASQKSSEDVIVVLEDLKHLDYAIADGREGLNKEHVGVGVKAIAIYHAAASAYLKSAGCPPRGQEWLANYNHDPTENIIKILPSRLKLLRKLGMSSVSEKLEALLPHMKEILELSLGKSSGPMSTILHGDLQVSNMLFHYKDTKVQRVSLIDWQLTGLGHPAYDLIYYLFPHAAPEFLHKDLKSAIHLYWNTFNETFEKFGYSLNDECYTYRSFAQEWNKTTIFGAVLGLTVIPTLIAEEKDLEGFLAKDEPLDGDLADLGKRLRSFVQFCESQGIIDSALKKYCPAAVPVELSDAVWAKVFAVEKGQTACAKMDAIASGNLITDGMDGYYVEDDDAKIKITVTKGSKPGDGYACETFCITATFPDGRKQQSFAKLIPDHPAQRGFIKMGGLQDKEVKMYKDLHATIRDLIGSKGLSDQIKVLAPKLVYGTVAESGSNPSSVPAPDGAIPEIVVTPGEEEDESILVLEDIKAKGFELHEKRMGVSLPAVRMAVTSLAQFHAGASALLRQSGLGNKLKGFEWLCEPMKMDMTAFFGQMLPSRLAQLRSLGAVSFADKAEKILPFLKSIFKMDVCGAYGPMETICQGDFWNNNMMFKFDQDRQPYDFLMYDWQLSRISHPAAELNYYLLANTTGELRKAHLNTILQDYYTTYKTALKKLGHSLDGHTFENFMTEYKKYMIFGFLMALVAIPAILMKSDDAKEMMEKMKDINVSEGQTIEEVFSAMSDDASVMMPASLANDELFKRRVLDLAEDVEASGALDDFLNAEAEISEGVWMEIFNTKKGQTAAKKLEDISDSVIVTEGKDGYYVKDGEEEVKVIVSRGSQLGDGFACDTFCITAIHNGRKLHSFTKVLPDNPMRRGFTKMSGIHDREVLAYRDLHPQIRELIASKGLAEEVKLLAPKCVFGKHCSLPALPPNPVPNAGQTEGGAEIKEEESILVLEDIKIKGFTMHDKRSGVSLPCVRTAVNSLAVYHAGASAILRKAGSEKVPEGLEWLCQPLAFDPTAVMRQAMTRQFDLIRSFGTNGFAAKAEKVFASVKSLFPIEKRGLFGPIETICHGDFWNNNMMFRFDNSSHPIDFVMFDWQLPRIGHPAMDLTYYLLANTTGELRKAHLSSILEEYYTSYTATLKKLGYPLDGHTFEDFMNEYKRHSVFGFFLALAVIPGIMMQAEDAKDMAEKMKNVKVESENFNDTMESMSKAFDDMPSLASDTAISKRIKDLVEEIEASGVIDHWLDREPEISEKVWEELFKTENGQSVSAKMDAIANGTLVTEGKDGYYIVDGEKEIKVTASRGSKLGEGYVCDTFSITVTDPEGRQLDCFAKLLAQGVVQRTFMKTGGMQERELKAYRDLHAEVRGLISEKGLSEVIQLSAPKLVYGKLVEPPAEDDETIILIENIKSKGYELLNKRKGVSLPNVRLALNALAQYHAGASAVLRKSGLGNKPKGLEWLCDKWRIDPSEMILQMLPQRLEMLKIVGADGFAEKASKALPLADKPFEFESMGIYGPMETICHGDFWTNNMMFKFGQDKQPTSIKLFDWQVPRIGHPAMDLAYYLLANTTGDFRKAHMTEVLSEYYTTYRSTMEKLGHSLDGHSFEKFLEEYNKELPRGFIMALMVIPGVMMQQEDVAEMMKKVDGDYADKGDLENKVSEMSADLSSLIPALIEKDDAFKNRLKDLVETIEASGVLDKLVESEKDLSEAEWERVFATEKGQTVAGKLEAIKDGKLVSADKDGYYVKGDKGDEIKVEVARGSAPGDNYACVVYAVTVTRPNGLKIQGFAKVLPENPASRMFAKMMMIQDKEIKIYEELHKDLRKLIAEKEEADKVHIKAPKVLYSRCDKASAMLFDPAASGPEGKSLGLSMVTNAPEDGPESILVMEDLRPLGFRLNDKRAGCNLAHVRTALKALAQYHASTSALMRKTTTPPKKFGWLALEGIDMNLDVNDLISKMVSTRLELLKALGAEEFANKLAKCVPIVASLWDPKSAGIFGPMEAILHGDFWNNNMMFKYSENDEPIDIRMVDWQMPRLGHPTADLSYYLLANTTSEFRKENQASVLKEYFDEYTSTLKALGYSLGGYGFETFMTDWRRNLIQGAIGALMALPPVMMQKDDAEELKEKMSKKEVDDSQGAEDKFVNAAADLAASFLSPALLNDPLFKDRVLGVVADVEAAGILDELIAEMNAPSDEKLSDKFWENLFATEKGETISGKLGKIVEGELKSEGKDEFQVADNQGKEYQVKAVRASAAGDNFMSDVYILTITGADSFQKSVFVKVLPNHPSLRGFARTSKVHNREILMYSQVFPYLRKLLKAAHIDDIKLAVPDVYYTRLDTPKSENSAEGATADELDDLESVIVLEDLRERGFKLNDKGKGCDEHHVRAALTAVAHYHALSSAFMRKRGFPPRGFEWVTEISFDPTELFTSMFTSRTELLKKLGFNSFAEKFEKLITCMDDLFRFDQVGVHGPTETIIHGDFWNNNMLFRYDENGKVLEMRTLDWQVTRPQKPEFDLSNFIVGNTLSDYRRNSMKSSLKSYYAEYKNVLLRLGYDVEAEGYSEDEFFKAWHRSSLRGLIFAIFWVPGYYEDTSKISERLSEDTGADSIEAGLAETMVNAMSGENDQVKKRVGDLIEDFEDVVDDFLAGKFAMD